MMGYGRVMGASLLSGRAGALRVPARLSPLSRSGVLRGLTRPERCRPQPSRPQAGQVAPASASSPQNVALLTSHLLFMLTAVPVRPDFSVEVPTLME